MGNDYQGQDAYIGCFIDSRLARDLNKLPGQIGNVWIGSNANMSVEACLNLCRSFTLPYAGLEFGNECYCGDSYGRYGQVADSECNYNCNGNANEICGGLTRLSVYSVRIMVRSVVNITDFNFSPIRAVQTVAADDETSNGGKVSWIEYSKETGQVHIYAYLDNNTKNNSEQELTVISLEARRADLASNRAYVFVSMRGNQLAAFYNCQCTDARLVGNDAALARLFFAPTVQPVYGQLVYNRNLNEVFRVYGCTTTRNDAYDQIYAQANSLLKDYCQLALNDLQRVNVQMANLIDTIVNDKKSTDFNLALVRNNLAYCSNKKC